MAIIDSTWKTAAPCWKDPSKVIPYSNKSICVCYYKSGARTMMVYLEDGYRWLDIREDAFRDSGDIDKWCYMWEAPQLESD